MSVYKKSLYLFGRNFTKDS